MRDLLKTLRSGLTVHGFRSSFSTWAAERTNYPKDIYEMALAHKVGNETWEAYQRGDLLDKTAQAHGGVGKVLRTEAGCERER